jgi:replicative DNA helicase
MPEATRKPTKYPTPDTTTSERAILGDFLLWPELFSQCAPSLRPEMFTEPNCRVIFETMAELHAAGQTWTRPILAQTLAAKRPGPRLQEAVLELTEHECGIDWACARECQHLRDAWLIREAQRAGAELAKAWLPGMPACDVLAPSLANLEALGAQIARQPETSVQVVLQEILAELRSGKRTPSLPSGLPEFDRNVGGFLAGAFYVVGARPSCGKTAVGVSLAVKAAKAGAAVRFISTETTRKSLTFRIVAHATGHDAKDIRFGNVPLEELAEGIPLVPTGIDVVDSGLSIEELCTETRNWRKRQGGKLALVIVDYLEEVRPPAVKSGSREQEISKIVVALHELAKAADCAVVAMSQLRRAATEADEWEGPTMADLRYSGMIEQAADVIMLLWRRKAKDDGGDALKLWGKVDKNKLGGYEFRMPLILFKGQSMVAEDATAMQEGR